VTRKYIGYFRLVDACERPGCPVCRCVVDDGRGQLEALLYEQVNDPDMRRRLRAAWGLCNWHAGTLSTLGTSRTGSAIIYEDLVRVAAGRVARLRDRRPPWLRRLFRAGGPARPRLVERYMHRAACPVCLASGDNEARYIDTALDFADDPQFARAYAVSTGLCVPHVVQAIDRRPGRPELDRLLDRTVEKWRTLRQRLDTFVRKHEYRNTEPISEAEGSACADAFEILGGAPGVFGNDLHAGRKRGAYALATKRITELQRENAELRAALAGRDCAPTDRAG
jgi:hypothetical protein